MVISKFQFLVTNVRSQYGHKRPGHKRFGHKRQGHKRPGHKRPGHKRPGHKRLATGIRPDHKFIRNINDLVPSTVDSNYFIGCGR